MRRSFLPTIACCLLTFSLQSVCGEDKDKDAKIDPKADKILQQMGKSISGLKQFSLEAETLHDEVLASGQKLQFSSRTTAAVINPNHLKAETAGDLRNRSVVYDGKSITIFDRDRKIAATAEAPDTLDKLFEELHKKYALTIPLADLIFSDPYKALTENVEVGGYVGLHQVNGVKCHHLAFRQRFIDWQIWIEADERSLPRKIAITYKQLPSAPQHVTVIDKWNVDAKLSDDAFKLTLPDGVKKVSLDKLFAAEKSDTDEK